MIHLARIQPAVVLTAHFSLQKDSLPLISSCIKTHFLLQNDSLLFISPCEKTHFHLHKDSFPLTSVERLIFTCRKTHFLLQKDSFIQISPCEKSHFHLILSCSSNFFITHFLSSSSIFHFCHFQILFQNSISCFPYIFFQYIVISCQYSVSFTLISTQLVEGDFNILVY